MRLHGHQGIQAKPTRSLPPDLSSGTCVGHPDAEMWSVDPSISGPYTTQKLSLWANAQVEHAKRLCQGCPVKAACLEAALVEEEDRAWRERYGTRGGQDRYERATMPRPAAPKREHGSTGGYQQHYRLNDLPVCDPCKDAKKNARFDYEANRTRARIRDMAAGRLIA